MQPKQPNNQGTEYVIPAQAGIHNSLSFQSVPFQGHIFPSSFWIPAYAGMTR